MPPRPLHVIVRDLEAHQFSMQLPVLLEERVIPAAVDHDSHGSAGELLTLRHHAAFNPSISELFDRPRRFARSYLCRAVVRSITPLMLLQAENSSGCLAAR